MDDKKIQWHLGFIAAMNLELKDYRKFLDFKKEYNLNTNALEIDLLIIRKEPSASITNEIGYFFRGHNILEYKSPEDRLDIDSLFKTLSYAGLYKAYEEKLNEIKEEDVTVSLIREAKPGGLFRHFKERGVAVSNPYNGIYYIEDTYFFPVQIIVTGELDKKNHTWLKSLSGRLNKEDMQDLLDKVGQMTEKFDMEMADSVLEVSVNANRHVIEKLIGDEGMFETLMEIMEPKINEIRKSEREEYLQKGLQEGRKEGREEGLQEGLQKGEKKGIQGAIGMLRNLQYKDEEIKSEIMKQYKLTEDEADEYLQS